MLHFLEHSCKWLRKMVFDAATRLSKAMKLLSSGVWPRIAIFCLPSMIKFLITSFRVAQFLSILSLLDVDTILIISLFWVIDRTKFAASVANLWWAPFTFKWRVMNVDRFFQSFCPSSLQKQSPPPLPKHAATLHRRQSPLQLSTSIQGLDFKNVAIELPLFTSNVMGRKSDRNPSPLGVSTLQGELQASYLLWSP